MKTIYEEIREIKDSNLPLEIKLCALWGLQNTKREEFEATKAFHEVLREAMPIGEPMRVKDIKERFNLPLSVQKLTAELRDMIYYGQMERRVIPTGKTFTVTVERWTFKSNEWGYWTEDKEINEEFAYYVRVR